MAKLYISSGHGGSDPGAVSGKNVEKVLNLPLAVAVADLLKQAGHTVILDKTTDKLVKINDKVKQANKEKVDAVFDIHFNAGGGTGCEAYHSIVGGTGKKLAENICSELAKLGFKNRGAKTRRNEAGKDYFGIIRDTVAPAVLIEVCFVDSKEDMARYNVLKAAQAIANGILSVYPAIVKAPVKQAQSAFKVGDVVEFKGGKHYKSSNAILATGGNRKAGKAKITAMNSKGKHPYHLIGIGSCNVYGWVNKDRIK